MRPRSSYRCWRVLSGGPGPRLLRVTRWKDHRTGGGHAGPGASRGMRRSPPAHGATTANGGREPRGERAAGAGRSAPPPALHEPVRLRHGRRPVFRPRHAAPRSRHQVEPARERSACSRGCPARHARERRRSGRTGRPAHLCHLLERTRRERVRGGSIPGAQPGVLRVALATANPSVPPAVIDTRGHLPRPAYPRPRSLLRRGFRPSEVRFFRTWP